VNHQMPTAETPASRNFSRGVLGEHNVLWGGY
jgi:hypothetical protein